MSNGTYSVRDSDILSYDPFQGDFGDQGDYIFKDRLVIARKQFQCVHCCGTILPRQLNRYLVARFDGQMRTYRWCSTCCDAMAQSLHDGGTSIDARTNLLIGTS